MSKINCEICGTVYPDNATACPICGTARPSGEKQEAPAENPEKAVERVKGGRFSHRNVKKRRKAAQKAELASQRTAPKASEPEDAPSEEEGGDGKGLKIAVAILLAAVLLVGAYIGIRFWRGWDAYGDPDDGSTASTSEPSDTSDPSDTTVPADVACTDIVIADLDLESGIEFQGEGRAWRLSITAQPEDTTDTLAIVSSDESIARVVVTEDRIEIVAVAPGSAEITVTCGDVVKTFPVNCVFETEATTEPTEETTEETTESTTEPTTEPAKLFQLDRSDITFAYEGETFTFSPGKGISVAQVTWASGDESIVTISDTGRATAVGEGTTYITATYNGETQRCIIRCSFPDETEPTEGSTGSTEPSDEWYITYEDVTIDVGETFTLRIRNAAGDTADVSWSFSVSGVVSKEGNTVTGVASGTTTASATYNGVTYRCIIRVR